MAAPGDVPCRMHVPPRPACASGRFDLEERADVGEGGVLFNPSGAEVPPCAAPWWYVRTRSRPR